MHFIKLCSFICCRRRSCCCRCSCPHLHSYAIYKAQTKMKPQANLFKVDLEWETFVIHLQLKMKGGKNLQISLIELFPHFGLTFCEFNFVLAFWRWVNNHFAKTLNVMNFNAAVTLFFFLQFTTNTTDSLAHAWSCRRFNRPFTFPSNCEFSRRARRRARCGEEN